jgi:CelD/BcsL family acetyltransferase involved in cellulose biosynthesis
MTSDPVIGKAAETAAAQAASAPALQFEVIRDEAALEALGPDWDALWQRSGSQNYSDGFAWHWRSWQCLAKPRGRHLHVLVGRHEGRAALIWPLAWHRDGPWRRGVWLCPEASEYNDLLVEPGPASQAWIAAAFDALRRGGGIDSLMLANVQDTARIMALLRAQPTRVIWQAPLSMLPLAEWRDWDTAFAKLNKTLRKDYRRSRNVLSRKGTIHFEVAETVEQVAEIVPWINAMKTAWVAERGTETMGLTGPRYERFLAEVAADALAQGHLYACALRVERTIVAAQLGFICGDMLEGYLTAYDPEWRQGGPGRYLLGETIRWAAAQGLRIIDFRIGDESYKDRWVEATGTVANYVLPCTAWGRVHFALSVAASRMPDAVQKAIYHKFRA